MTAMTAMTSVTSREAGAVFRAVVFDLDGTLIDSRRDIATAVNAMLADLGLEPLSVERVVAMVGEGARVLVRRALGELAATLPPERMRAALASYLVRYREVCLHSTRPYPGVPAMLAELAPSFPLAVLSNKGEALSRLILNGLGLDRYLREVVGGDTLPTRKPNPGGLFWLADRLAVSAGELLLVGDSPIDAETARAAACPFALAAWGSPRPPGADGVEAGWRFATPDELVAAFTSGQD
jgi:phosphoglycolate phosphatase